MNTNFRKIVIGFIAGSLILLFIIGSAMVLA